MNGEWCYFKSHFSPQDCRKILELSSNIPEKDATLGVEGVSVDTQIRKSKVKFLLKDNTDFSYLFDEMWRLALWANRDWFNFHITKMDYIQLAEYDESYRGEYKKHHDVFWVNNDPFYHRKLTAVIQLTDPNNYEGGNLELVDAGQQPNSQEIRSQGTVIFFPSFLYHQATQVTKGTRHSLACWFDGPKWR